MFTEISLIFKRKLRATRRNPVFIGMSLMTPLLYLLLFAPLLKNLTATPFFPSRDVLQVFVPGMLTLIAFGGNLFVGFAIIDELHGGVIERLRVLPISRFAILCGMVLHDVMMSLFSIMFFVVVSLPFGFRIDILGCLILLILLALVIATTAAFSYTIGLITQNDSALAPIVHGIHLPMTLLAGTLLPMGLAPGWLKMVAHFNPLYYVVEAARHLAVGELTDVHVLYAFLYMGFLSIVVLRWATKVFAEVVS